MINPKTLDFLKRLAKNNNRTWFKEHKSEFDSINRDFLEFVEELAQDISRFDKRVADSLHDKSTAKVFRIYKDVRFSKDKSPYKLNLGGTITPFGMKSGHPGYYLHIQPDGESFVGGGLHMPDSKILNKIREKISEDADGLKSILNDSDFKKCYQGLSEYDMLKTVPRGYDKDHPDAELLKFKSFTALRQLDDKQILANDFYDKVLSSFNALYDFNNYFEQVIFSD